MHPQRPAVTRHYSIGVLGLMALISMSGCGGAKKVKVYPAAGTVSIDGKPVEPAKIVLQPASADSKLPAATGDVGSNGSFKLHTYVGDDGIAEGKFNIVVVSDPMKMTPVPAAKPLTVEIKRGTSGSIDPLKFELEGIKGAKQSIGAPLPIAGGGPPAMPNMPTTTRPK